MKNVTHPFILNVKQLPIHWLTVADVFRDIRELKQTDEAAVTFKSPFN